MMGVPVWFKSLVYSEIFLQLPFFFVAAYALMGAPCCGHALLLSMLFLRRACPCAPHPLPPCCCWRRCPVLLLVPLLLPVPNIPPWYRLARRCAAGKNWIRAPAMLYGSFVTATMLPILAELSMHQGEPAWQPNSQPATVASAGCHAGCCICVVLMH
jgi:hypothetical protein